MQLYEVFTFIICLAALFSFINHRFIKWTPTIGVMALSLLFSLGLPVAAHYSPAFAHACIVLINAIDFHDILMNGMLGFLLFAGSVHINAESLKKEIWPIMALATLGIFISTFLVGVMLHYLFLAFSLQVAYIYCFLFAALISPTDPIAVLAILKKAGIPKSLELKIAGESLFNDGVAVVIFLTLLEIAQTGVDAFSVTDVSLLFLREAVGGLLYGAVLGYLGYWLIHSIDKYEVAVMISIALVMGGYLLACKMHISGPLAMVVAGIIIGSPHKKSITNTVAKNYLLRFWELIDEMLNAILFMLIGLEMLVIKFDLNILIIGGICILGLLLCRWISVAIPLSLLKYKMSFERHAITLLSWGGLRGGLSVALALSLPLNMYRSEFVAITYVVVVFSIIVQGLSIGGLYKKISGTQY